MPSTAQQIWEKAQNSRLLHRRGEGEVKCATEVLARVTAVRHKREQEIMGSTDKEKAEKSPLTRNLNG